MSKRIKRAPPYEDDPGCKYIVISDPWPGDKSGKARGEVYWNLLAAWVRFMLNKEHEVTCVYSVNTRSDVIVQLPEEADIVPVLGAHPWIKVLASGHPKDRDRVSHVFAYDYRMKGEPEHHNWLAHYPSENGDPPRHIKFPVKFPYPHASWALPKGRSCADLALPLPPIREPTHEASTALNYPYTHTLQPISRNDLDAVDKKPIQQDQKQQVGKLEPFASFAQDMMSLRDLQQETLDIKPSIKQEDGIRIKTEAVKLASEIYGPSKEFRKAIEQLHRARDAEHAKSPSESERTGSVKAEEEPSKGPSDAFIAAFNSVRSAQIQAPHTFNRTIDAKREEMPYQPSSEFVRAIEGIRRPAVMTSNEPLRRISGERVVNLEQQPRNFTMLAAASEQPRVKPEPGDRIIETTHGTTNSSHKRVKEEPRDGRSAKRFRT